MESTIIIAKILGPLYLIIGVGILFNLKKYQKVIEEFIKNPALIYLGGLIALLFGLIIVSFHNVWEPNLSVIITIMGWLALIKGATLIIIPDVLVKTSEIYLKSAVPLIIHLIVVFILGALLSVMGYLR